MKYTLSGQNSKFLQAHFETVQNKLMSMCHLPRCKETPDACPARCTCMDKTGYTRLDHKTAMMWIIGHNMISDLVEDFKFGYPVADTVKLMEEILVKISTYRGLLGFHGHGNTQDTLTLLLSIFRRAEFLLRDGRGYKTKKELRLLISLNVKQLCKQSRIRRKIK